VQPVLAAERHQLYHPRVCQQQGRTASGGRLTRHFPHRGASGTPCTPSSPSMLLRPCVALTQRPLPWRFLLAPSPASPESLLPSTGWPAARTHRHYHGQSHDSRRDILRMPSPRGKCRRPATDVSGCAGRRQRLWWRQLAANLWAPAPPLQDGGAAGDQWTKASHFWLPPSRPAVQGGLGGRSHAARPRPRRPLPESPSLPCERSSTTTCCGSLRSRRAPRRGMKKNRGNDGRRVTVLTVVPSANFCGSSDCRRTRYRIPSLQAWSLPYRGPYNAATGTTDAREPSQA